MGRFMALTLRSRYAGSEKRHEASIAEGATWPHVTQWSGRLDLNQRPPAPEAGALPGYATPRRQLSYRLSFTRLNAPRRTRTSNLLIRSQMLYPIELWALVLLRTDQQDNSNRYEWAVQDSTL